MATSTRSSVEGDPAPERASNSDLPRSTFWLYDRDGEDHRVDRDDFNISDLGEMQMLWVDVDLESAEDLVGLWQELEVEKIVAGLDGRSGPSVAHHGGCLEVQVTAVRWADSGPRPMTLHCLVGENWVATLHEGELDLVDGFNEPFHGETSFGELTGPAFLSVILDWQLSGYFEVIEQLQTDIDHLDEELLETSPDEVVLLRRLQEMRRQVRELRKHLSPHRQVIELLSHPQADTELGSELVASYRPLSERLQQALDSVDTAREMIVGSFDILMTRTSQATNDVMKRLTIVSVLLLPSVVVAGVMGMNFKARIFEWSWMFWVTLVLMGILAGTTLIVAKRKKWL